MQLQRIEQNLPKTLQQQFLYFIQQRKKKASISDNDVPAFEAILNSIERVINQKSFYFGIRYKFVSLSEDHTWQFLSDLNRSSPQQHTGVIMLMLFWIIHAKKYNQLMWNLCSSSKLTEQRIRRKHYEQHREKVATMKPRMRISEPQQPDFVYLKPKQELTRREKLAEIDRQNEILLAKMEGIKIKPYTQNRLRPEAQQLTTLNRAIVEKKADEVFQENKRICTKLLRVSSHYPTFQTLTKADQLDSIRDHISQNARRARPTSSCTTRSSRFYRSRVHKYDQQGNNSQQRINVLYKVTSEATLRPDSAPANRCSSSRYRSERPSRNMVNNEQAYALMPEGKLQAAKQVE